MEISTSYFWFSFMLGLVAVAPMLVYLHKLDSQAMTMAAGSGLVIAALIYLGFALYHGDNNWFLIESGGLIAYGFSFWLAMRYTPLWLAAGWGLHPLWDIFLHWLGPGTHIAPIWYAIACLSFDLAVAGYLAWRYLRVPRSTSSQ